MRFGAACRNKPDFDARIEAQSLAADSIGHSVELVRARILDGAVALSPPYVSWIFRARTSRILTPPVAATGRLNNRTLLHLIWVLLVTLLSELLIAWVRGTKKLSAMDAFSYFTAIVTLFELDTPFTTNVSGTTPVGASLGIRILICVTPEIKYGA
jgi:hypothetical protein